MGRMLLTESRNEFLGKVIFNDGIDMQEINENEVERKLRKIEKSKALGSRNIRIELVKHRPNIHRNTCRSF